MAKENGHTTKCQCDECVKNREAIIEILTELNYDYDNDPEGRLTLEQAYDENGNAIEGVLV